MRTGFASDGARVLLLYLAGILLLQALAAAWALGAGPLHTHLSTGPALAAAFSHHAHPHAKAHTHEHTHEHSSAQRHHHGADDTSVQPDAAEQDAAEAARLALTVALSLLATQTPRALPAAHSHPLPATRPLFWRSRVPLPLYRPPSQA